MKKENWINSILESASAKNDAEPNPYLYNKILDRMNSSEKVAPGVRYTIGWMATVSLVIMINVSALYIYKSKMNEQNKVTAIEALSNEMVMNTTYNF